MASKISQSPRLEGKGHPEFLCFRTDRSADSNDTDDAHFHRTASITYLGIPATIA
jgi:hypothetical protein